MRVGDGVESWGGTDEAEFFAVCFLGGLEFFFGGLLGGGRGEGEASLRAWPAWSGVNDESSAFCSASHAL